MSDRFHEDLFTAVQGYLAAVGIKAELQLQGAGQMGEMGFGTGWSDGIFGHGMVNDPNLLPMRFFLAEFTQTGMAKSIIHPDDVEDAWQKVTVALDFEAKQAAAFELQSLMFDEYCIFTPIMFYPNVAAWSVKVHDEPFESYPSQDPWSFADTWIEQ
jgi:hypothetical protein